MDLSFKQVEHIRFGAGTILEQNDGIIKVRFFDSNEEKRFVYPDAFEKFLKMKDPSDTAIISKDLETRIAQVKAEIEDKQRQNEERKAKEALKASLNQKVKVKPLKKTVRPKKKAD